ncbi:MAG: AAA family ATPase, partial [Acidimicrobiales bacterium]
MFLKSLDLKGFKSFADTTTLELEPGITVVVGPNGSGKSNVVDAVAWVLGAQGPRTMRSSRMDDVIFAGTGSRPALGRAEVSLTIDNGSGAVAIPMSEVTIRRTLFRSGESEYALNGSPCRLLDIQELLSDSGVGRTQHIIVGQGQLEGILDAHPEDRRAVIEEAAGVLKFRRRKEKAERRLAATEGNVVRLSDLLRELRRQLRPLERQAEAARRHGDLVAELIDLRRHVAGRELAALEASLGRAEVAGAALVGEEVELGAELARLDQEVGEAEAELAVLGGGGLADALIEAERLVAQCRGLAAVLAERRRGLGRERERSVDQTVVATLEAEAARLGEVLAEAEAEAGPLAADADRLAQAEERLATERAAFERTWPDPVTVSSARAAEVRGELAARRAGVERAGVEASALGQRLDRMRRRVQHLGAEAESLRAQVEAAEAAEEPLVGELQRAESRRVALEASLARAEAVLGGAESDRHAWTARAEALALSWADASGAVGEVAGWAGVLGVLADLVEVDPGWEAAFAAAVGDAAAAVVVDGDQAVARGVLGELDRAGAATVLAVGATPVPAAPPPGVGEPVRAHVRSHHRGVERVLDAVLGSTTRVGPGLRPALSADGDRAAALAAALDASLAHPDVVVVTGAGDRLTATGWWVGRTGPGGTRAALE